MSDNYLFKIIVIGDIGTGKTSIIKRYVRDQFSSNYKCTIGVDFFMKELKLYNGSTAKLQLWDIAGQERFGNMTRVYYKDAVGVCVVVDVNRVATLEAVKKWKSDVDEKLSKNIPAILLINKCDSSDKDDWEPENIDDINMICTKYGFVDWFKTSAKHDLGIDESMMVLVNTILDSNMNNNNEIDCDIIRPVSFTRVDDKQKKKSSGCC